MVGISGRLVWDLVLVLRVESVRLVLLEDLLLNPREVVVASQTVQMG